MNADPRNPKVGDVFISAHGETVTITAVGDQRALARVSDGAYEHAFGLASIAGMKSAPARPMVAECWGLLLQDGRFWCCRSELKARMNRDKTDTVARICHLTPEELVQFGDLFAVICDENKNPIPIEIPS